MSKNNSEWILEPLINLGTLVKGKLTLQSENEIPNWLPLINTDSLKNTSRIWANTDGAVTCNKNDVLILWDGERSGLAATNKEGIVGSTFGRFRPTSKIDGKYLYYFIDSKFEWIQNRRTGTGVPHAPKDLSKILFIYYHKDINVQKKIAQILTTCDTVIVQTQAAIEKYKAIKQGMLHDLFTRGLDANGQLRPTPLQAPERYKNSELGLIPKEWEVKRLGKYLISLEAGVSVNSTDTSTTDDIAVLKTSAVFNGTFNPYENKKVITKDIERVKTNPKADSIIISRMNTPMLVGECGYVDRDYPLLFLPDRLWQTVFLDKKTINVRWVNYLLNTENYSKTIKDSATGTSDSMKNITKDVFFNLRIPYMPFDEQNNITEKLISIDTKLQSEEALLSKYQSIKKGLMKDLLSGEREV